MSFFRVNGIAAIPLKGPFMARYIYGDLDLRRTSTDIDFLIPKEHFKETVAKLKEAGYYLPDDKPDDDRHYRFRREVPLLKKDGGDILRLELHWDLRDAFTSTHIEEFWAGARNIDYNGIRIMAPSDEDLILYLALKSVFVFDTNFIDIRYLFDIHNMVSKFRDKIDWNVLSQKSRRFGTNVHMSYAFKYSCDFFGTRIPDSLLIRLEDTGFKPRLLKSKIDKEKILWSSSNVRSSYTWYFLTSSYLFSDNLLGFLKSIWRKMRRAARLYLSCEI